MVRRGKQSLLLPPRGVAFNGRAFAVAALANDELAARAMAFAAAFEQQSTADRAMRGEYWLAARTVGVVSRRCREHASPRREVHAWCHMYRYTHIYTSGQVLSMYACEKSRFQTYWQPNERACGNRCGHTALTSLQAPGLRRPAGICRRDLSGARAWVAADRSRSTRSRFRFPATAQ